MNYRERLHRVIPGGAHTYSRGDDQYPSNAPPILAHGSGAYVFDAEGRRYLDYGMALRAVTLGYGYEPVAQAAIEEIRKGNQLTRASLTELRAAELLSELIPGADMVKFGKNGSTMTSAAVKLSRAYTGRKYLAICGDHPFFSYDDWFIGSTVVDQGVPQDIASLTLKFTYNDPDSLAQLFSRYPGQIACVILEPATSVSPCPSACAGAMKQDQCRNCPKSAGSFLHQVQELCRVNGAVFILDEMITGFRWHLNGAQTFYGVQADLTTFGKGMANGFSVSALAGKREIMELGGILREGAERVFLVSTTHGAEMNGLGAFIETVRSYREHDVVGHLWSYGESLMQGMNQIARELGIADCFALTGYPCSPNYVTRDRSGAVSLELRTLFSQEMIREGVLMPWIALSLSHGVQELELTLAAARQALAVYAQALEQGTEPHLQGRAIKPVFRKYN